MSLMRVAISRLASVVSMAVCVAAGLWLGTEARADAYCDALQAQYNAVSGGSRMGQGQRSALMQEYRQTQFALRQYDCDGFSLFQRAHPACRSIRGHLNQLRRQLSGPRGDNGFFGNQFERQRITSAMRRYGCGGPQVEMATGGGGGYRTLCVRSCDGYFFPISFSASRSKFKIDEAVCKGMYPEGAASLYVVSNATDADRAVSLKGEPLANQTFEADHLKTFVPACKAQLTEGLQSLRVRYEAALTEKLAERGKKPGKAKRKGRQMMDPPFPEARPAPGEDPETLANRDGGFVISTEPEAPLLAELTPGKAVRIIGDDFFVALPSEEEAEAMSKAHARPKPLGPDVEPMKAGILPGSELRGALDTTGTETIGLP
jgi:hypothetical protein